VSSSPGVIAFYLDEMMPRSIAEQMTARGYHAVVSVDVGMAGKEDSEHLQYATANGLVLVTRDKPFAGRAMREPSHGGVICWTGAQHDVGGIVRALAEFAEKRSPEDARGGVFWLR
jgi:hypothetical protein